MLNVLAVYSTARVWHFNICKVRIWAKIINLIRAYLKWLFNSTWTPLGIIENVHYFHFTPIWWILGWCPNLSYSAVSFSFSQSKDNFPQNYIIPRCPNKTLKQSFECPLFIKCPATHGQIRGGVLVSILTNSCVIYIQGWIYALSLYI